MRWLAMSEWHGMLYTDGKPFALPIMHMHSTLVKTILKILIM